MRGRCRQEPLASRTSIKELSSASARVTETGAPFSPSSPASLTRAALLLASPLFMFGLCNLFLFISNGHRMSRVLWNQGWLEGNLFFVLYIQMRSQLFLLESKWIIFASHIFCKNVNVTDEISTLCSDLSILKSAIKVSKNNYHQCPSRSHYVRYTIHMRYYSLTICQQQF